MRRLLRNRHRLALDEDTAERLLTGRWLRPGTGQPTHQPARQHDPAL